MKGNATTLQTVVSAPASHPERQLLLSLVRIFYTFVFSDSSSEHTKLLWCFSDSLLVKRKRQLGCVTFFSLRRARKHIFWNPSIIFPLILIITAILPCPASVLCYRAPPPSPPPPLRRTLNETRRQQPTTD